MFGYLSKTDPRNNQTSLKNTTMGYAVFHASKGSGTGGKLGAHIDRDQSQKQTFKSADPERTHLNKDLLNNEFSNMKLEDAIKKRLEQGYTGKKAIRKDAIKFIPMVMTGSHKEMKEIFNDSKKANDWIKANYEFACKEFGKQNIVRCTLHLDEKTPHLHIVAVPLTQDGRLSAKEVFGNRTDLSERQTRYGEAMRDFGLKRGLVGSKAVHNSEGWYIAKQKEAEKAILSPLEKLNFLERLNPLKKIQALTDGLKLAQNHKFDSDQKAQREEAKVLELSNRYEKLKQAYGQVIRSESRFKAEQEKIVTKLQENIRYEVNRQLERHFRLHELSPEERNKLAIDTIFDISKKQKGINQELYDKAMSKDNFHKNLSQAFENKAQQSQEREQRKQTRGNRLGY